MDMFLRFAVCIVLTHQQVIGAAVCNNFECEPTDISPHLDVNENISILVRTPCTSYETKIVWRYALARDMHKNISVDLPCDPPEENILTADIKRTEGHCPEEKFQTESTLHLKGQTNKFLGWKVCFVATVHGIDHSGIYRYENDIVFPVPVGDVILKNVSSNNDLQVYETKEDDTMTFVCETTPSFPEAQVTWFLNKIPLLRKSRETRSKVINETILTKTTSTLKVTVNYTMDTQTIHCSAENIAGKHRPKSKSVRLSVEYKPHGTTVPYTEIVSPIGKEVNLTCSVMANPLPFSYIWYFSEEELAETSETITFTVYNKSTYGEYMCHAVNREGTSEAIYFLLKAPEIVTAGNSSSIPVWGKVLIGVSVFGLCCIFGICIYCLKRGGKDMNTETSLSLGVMDSIQVKSGIDEKPEESKGATSAGGERDNPTASIKQGASVKEEQTSEAVSGTKITGAVDSDLKYSNVVGKAEHQYVYNAVNAPVTIHNNHYQT